MWIVMMSPETARRLDEALRELSGFPATKVPPDYKLVRIGAIMTGPFGEMVLHYEHPTNLDASKWACRIRTEMLLVAWFSIV